MASKHHKPEKVIAKLRQVEVLMAQGKMVASAVRAIVVTEGTLTTTAPVSRAVSSRNLFGGAAAVVFGGGSMAGVAVSVGDYVPADANPDAALLALRAELTAAVTGIAYDKDAPDRDDEEISRFGGRLSVA